MKRIIHILLIISVSILAASLLIKPIIVLLVKAQLKKVFIGSEVSVQRCSLKPAHLLTFSNIEIKKGQIYNFKVREAGLQYDFLSLFKKTITKFYLKDVLISVNLPQKSILQLKSFLNATSQSAFLAKILELSNLQLDLKSKDLNLRAKLSFELSLMEQLVRYLDVNITSLDSQGLQIEDAILRVNQLLLPGEFYIRQIKYNKLKIREIKSRVDLKKESLLFDSLSADVLDGEIKGDLSLRIDKDLEYLIHLKFINLDLDTFVNDFDLQEKAQMNGKIEGEVALHGKGFDIKVLNGGFSTVSPGGTLLVKDDKLLENISRNSGQSLEIIVESFKNYHYNTGIVKLYLDKGNLIFEVALDGEAGKRNLNITLHDFKLGREGI